MVSRWEPRTNGNTALRWYLRRGEWKRHLGVDTLDEFLEHWHLNEPAYQQPPLATWNDGPLGSLNFRPPREAIAMNDSFFRGLANVWRHGGLFGREWSPDYSAIVTFAWLVNLRNHGRPEDARVLRAIWTLCALLAHPSPGRTWVNHQGTDPATEQSIGKAGPCDNRYTAGIEVAPVGERCSPWCAKGSSRMGLMLSAALDYPREHKAPRRQRSVALPIAPPDDPKHGTLTLEDGTETSVQDWNDGLWVLGLCEQIMVAEWEEYSAPGQWGLTVEERDVLTDVVNGDPTAVRHAAQYLDGWSLWSEIQVVRTPEQVSAVYRYPSNGNKPAIQGATLRGGAIDTWTLEDWNRKSGARPAQAIYQPEEGVIWFVHLNGREALMPWPDVGPMGSTLMFNRDGISGVGTVPAPDPSPGPPEPPESGDKGCLGVLALAGIAIGLLGALGALLL